MIFCDAGCGNGIYLKYFQNNHPNVGLYGFDFSKTIVDITKQNTGLDTIITGNLEESPFGDGKFDLILCTQVIEHMIDDKKAMSELHRMLKESGYLVISTDNKDDMVSKILNAPFKLFSYLIRLLRKNKKAKEFFPHKEYPIKEFTDLIQSQNFKIINTSTFRFSLPWPFYKIKACRSLLDEFEKLTSKMGWFKNRGDIVIALCKK